MRCVHADKILRFPVGRDSNDDNMRIIFYIGATTMYAAEVGHRNIYRGTISDDVSGQRNVYYY